MHCTGFALVLFLAAAPALAETADAARHTASTTATVLAPRVDPRLILKPREQVGLLRTSLGLRKTMLADRAVMVDLQGRFREFMVASVDAQGVPHIGCVHNERALRQVLEGRSLAAPARFEER